MVPSGFAMLTAIQRDTCLFVRHMFPIQKPMPSLAKFTQAVARNVPVLALSTITCLTGSGQLLSLLNGKAGHRFPAVPVG